MDGGHRASLSFNRYCCIPVLAGQHLLISNPRNMANVSPSDLFPSLPKPSLSTRGWYSGATKMSLKLFGDMMQLVHHGKEANSWEDLWVWLNIFMCPIVATVYTRIGSKPILCAEIQVVRSQGKMLCWTFHKLLVSFMQTCWTPLCGP